MNDTIIINCRGKAQNKNSWWDNAIAKARNDIMQQIDDEIFKVLDSARHFEYKNNE